MVPVNGIILRKAETPHWSEPAELLEERVVGRRYEGGSQGMSIRIAKGLSYRIGAQKGRLITDKAMVSVSKGDLIITNQRVIFQGSMKSINLPFTKLLEFRCLDDGIVLTNDKGKPCFIQFFNSKNGAIVEAIFLKANIT